MPELFVDKVIALIEQDECSYSEHTEHIFSRNYNDDYCSGRETWHTVIHLGILYEYPVLYRRDDMVPLKWREKVRLIRAMRDGLKRYKKRRKFFAQMSRFA